MGSSIRVPPSDYNHGNRYILNRIYQSENVKMVIFSGSITMELHSNRREPSDSSWIWNRTFKEQILMMSFYKISFQKQDQDIWGLRGWRSGWYSCNDYLAHWNKLMSNRMLCCIMTMMTFQFFIIWFKYQVQVQSWFVQ